VAQRLTLDEDRLAGDEVAGVGGDVDGQGSHSLRVGEARYMVIVLASGQCCKTGPFCNEEEACWRRRYPPRQYSQRLQEIYGE
jgi:hypothetical protein